MKSSSNNLSMKTRTATRLASKLIAFVAALVLPFLQVGESLVAAGNFVMPATSLMLIQSAPTLDGRFHEVNVGPGDQFDPRVDCNLASYTEKKDRNSTIHYFNFTTNTDAIVPLGNDGDCFLSDVYGSRVSFTNINSVGSQVITYDTVVGSWTGGGLNQNNSSIGNNLVAYENLGLLPNPTQSEIAATRFNPLSGLIRITEDELMDITPAVSPDGNNVVFAKCQPSGLDCDIYVANQTSPGVFTTIQLTGPKGEDSNPETNGTVVVYTSTRAGETDIFYQPIAGGPETQLTLPGEQRNPRIAGDLISFESRTIEGNYDIYVYDISTSTLYRVTKTPVDENSSDITVCNGQGRIVYSAPAANGDLDVLAFSFNLPSSVLQVVIDIKPGEFPNSINLGSNGNVPVGIMSTPTFDATTVDPLTVELAGASVALRGKGTPMASAQDLNGDGLLDLVVHVITEALQLTAVDTQATLTGQTSEGVSITGMDSVRIVP